MANLDSEGLERFPARSAAEVAQRCLVLYAIVAAGHNTARDDLKHWSQGEGIWEAVSAEEVAFLESRSLSRQQMIAATWRVEGVLVLLWALTKVRLLPPPMSICDVPLLRSLLPPLLGSTAEFISSARLRDQTEILEAHEEIYRAHWTVRDAALNRRPIVNGPNPEILQERHLALNWLIFPDQAWDDITTDT